MIRDIEDVKQESARDDYEIEQLLAAAEDAPEVDPASDCCGAPVAVSRGQDPTIEWLTCRQCGETCEEK